MLKTAVKKEQLLYHLDVVSKALLTKSPIYSGIRISFLKKSIELAATNGNMYITSMITDLSVVGDGLEILVNGALIINIVKKLDARYIDLEVSDKLVIKAGKSKFTLTLLDITCFKKHESWVPKVNFSLVGLEFKNLIKRVIVAAATSETRPTLAGVNLKIEDGKLYAYASDSFRIAKDYLPIEAKENIDIIIPATSLNELIKIMRDDVIDICLNDVYAMFNFGTSQLETRLINGDFPNVESFIPTDFLMTKIVDRQNLISSLERASVILDNSSSQVVKIDFESGLATISTIYNEVGQAREEIITDGASESISIAMSHKYLTDALKTFTAEEVEINIKGETMPLVITAKDNKENIKQLILPVRL